MYFCKQNVSSKTSMGLYLTDYEQVSDSGLVLTSITELIVHLYFDLSLFRSNINKALYAGVWSCSRQLWHIYVQINPESITIWRSRLESHMHRCHSHLDVPPNDLPPFINYQCSARAYSHQAKMPAKAKKMEEQAWMIKEQECIPVGCVPPTCWLYPIVSHVSEGGVCPTPLTPELRLREVIKDQKNFRFRFYFRSV